MGMYGHVWRQKLIRFVILASIVVLLIELFVFNFRHWESRKCEEIKDFSVVTGEGLILQPDGSYLLGETNRYLEFNKINKELSTLRIDIEILDRENGEKEPVMLYLAARDDSHENYYWIPDRQIWHSQPRSQYLTWHLYGNCKSIKVTPALDTGTHIRINFELNPVIPMFFSITRVLIILAFCVALYLLRPTSFVCRIPFLDMKRGKSIALVAFFLIHLLAVGMLIRINPVFRGEPAVNHEQYQRLAEAFSQGKVWLLQEPSEALKKMQNPYDYDYRRQVMLEEGQDFLWDHAYFQGKYYVYFGVVPVVLFYLPYYLLTGTALHNYQVVFIGATLMLLGIIGVICQTIRRWFPKTSFGVWYLLTELVVLGSGFLYICKRPDLYTVPIVVGLGLGLMGVWLFLSAEKEGKLSTFHIACGSLCTALVAGCRPQLFLFILLDIVILRKFIFSIRYLRTGEGKKNTLAFVMPMIAIATLLMVYNYVRFGSVFDFGANYNLTFNDMRNRGFVLDRLPLGIWAYLFAPLKWTLDFPFAEANFFTTQYLGVTISEATYGGLFAVNLFVWIILVFILFRKKIGNHTLRALVFLSAVAGVIIICADTEMSGILMRYFSDFSVFFLLSAIWAWLLLFNQVESGWIRKYMLYFLILCLLLTIFYQGRIFFLDTGEALKDVRKDLFAQIKYLVMFWI